MMDSKTDGHGDSSTSSNLIREVGSGGGVGGVGGGGGQYKKVMYITCGC